MPIKFREIDTILLTVEKNFLELPGVLAALGMAMPFNWRKNALPSFKKWRTDSVIWIWPQYNPLFLFLPSPTALRRSRSGDDVALSDLATNTTLFEFTSKQNSSLLLNKIEFPQTFVFLDTYYLVDPISKRNVQQRHFYKRSLHLKVLHDRQSMFPW